jgi:hypothetical protein
MKLDVKPTLVIIGTLIIGMVLGALSWSALMRHRMEHLHGMMGHGGFQQSLISAIGSMSSEQRVVVEGVIGRTFQRMDSTINAGKSQIDSMIVTMNARLDSVLTPEQRASLRREIGNRPRGPNGPPFGGPHQGGPPPDGPNGGRFGQPPPPPR